MSLFEFLMILLSIIVGLGISELLTGFARILRTGRLSELCLAHGALLLTLFMALLQVFWEGWYLGEATHWTFTALVLLLTAPILLYLATHIVIPEDSGEPLADYYFAKSRMIYALLVLAATMGMLFKTLAFGAPLFIVDNITSFPTIGILAALAWSKNRWLHNILVPTCLVLLVLDTVTISNEIR